MMYTNGFHIEADTQLRQRRGAETKACVSVQEMRAPIPSDTGLDMGCGQVAEWRLNVPLADDACLGNCSGLTNGKTNDAQVEVPFLGDPCQVGELELYAVN